MDVAVLEPRARKLATPSSFLPSILATIQRMVRVGLCRLVRIHLWDSGQQSPTRASLETTISKEAVTHDVESKTRLRSMLTWSVLDGGTGRWPTNTPITALNPQLGV